MLAEEPSVSEGSVNECTDNAGKLTLIAQLNSGNTCPKFSPQICPRCPETACYRSLGRLQSTRFSLNMFGAEANLSNLEVSSGRSKKNKRGR